jgi:hypothetical protein
MLPVRTSPHPCTKVIIIYNNMSKDGPFYQGDSVEQCASQEEE